MDTQLHTGLGRTSQEILGTKSLHPFERLLGYLFRHASQYHHAPHYHHYDLTTTMQ